MRPRVGIELDDSSHAREDRQARDAFVEQVFEAAGVALLRFPRCAPTTFPRLLPAGHRFSPEALCHRHCQFPWIPFPPHFARSVVFRWLFAAAAAARNNRAFIVPRLADFEAD